MLSALMLCSVKTWLISAQLANLLLRVYVRCCCCVCVITDFTLHPLQIISHIGAIAVRERPQEYVCCVWQPYAYLQISRLRVFYYLQPKPTKRWGVHPMLKQHFHNFLTVRAGGSLFLPNAVFAASPD